MYIVILFLAFIFFYFGLPAFIRAIDRALLHNPVQYVKGDATQPVGKGKKLIIHCCNDIGAWGAGFVLALSRRDHVVEQRYRDWYKDGKHGQATGKFRLGEIQPCWFTSDRNLWVANMIGQHGCGPDEKGNPPIRYDAIRKCLKKVRKWCIKHNASVHAPRFGAGLAGGDWSVIEGLLIKELTNWDIPVTVYDYE